MTVPVNDRRIQYTATAAQTIFPYDFKIDANTELEVKQTVYTTGDTNTLTLTTEYTVSGVGDAGGGNVTLVTGAAVDDTITIIGNTPLSRVTDFNQAGDFLMSDLNNQLDKLTNILQENDTTINRAVKLKDEDTTSSLEIPTATNRASKFLAFDASGDAIASAGTTETTVSSFMATVLDDTTAAAARTTLDAEQKTNSLTAITTLEDADQFIVADNSDSGNSKKITKLNLANALATDAATTSTLGTTLIKKRIIGSNGTDTEHDIDFTAGSIDFSDGSGQAYIAALTKQADATFATGDNSGAMASGQSLPTSGTVHWFGLSDANGTTVDIGCDTDVDATNLLADSVVIAAGLTKYQRILSLRTDASANFLAFTQYANHIFWTSPPTDLSTSSTTTSKTNLSITVPNSIEVMATLGIGAREGGLIYTNVFSEGQDDSSPVQDNRDFCLESGSRTGLEVSRYTQSATVAYRLSATTPDKLTIKTKSFVDLGI